MKKIVIFTLLLLLSIHAGAQIIIVGDLTHEKETRVGESYQGAIEISNVGSEDQEVKVDLRDYLFFSDGTSSYTDPGTVTRSNTGWIVYSPKRFTVPAGEKQEILYTLKVPDDASLKGTYWSIFLIEAIPKTSLESSEADPEEVGLGIMQTLRYGIQVVTHIRDTGTRKIKFLSTKLLKEEDKRILQLDIENIGERWLRALLWAELYDDAGNTLGPYEGGKLRIYPGTSVRFRVDLTEVPSDKYKSLVVIDCGGDDVFGASFSLKF